MSYTALYRKYRPKDFKSVVGQNSIVTILINSIKSNKINHAYLFSGPRGTGKTSVAKIFAKAINCLDFNDDICFNCKMCKNLESNDIDILEIDAASNNGVEEIREIRSNAKLLPSIAKYKVYIIDEVHMLSIGAFNALLKTLEEPPEHVVFILATTEITKIPLTVLSRCQRLDFKKIIAKDLKERLKFICDSENKKVNEDVLNLITELSDGCLRDAINLLDQVISYSKDDFTVDDLYLITGDIPNKIIVDFFDSIYQNKLKENLEFINNFYESGKDFNKIIDKLLILLRNISINNNISTYFDNDKIKEFDKYKKISNDEIQTMTILLNDLYLEMKKSNNQKILFELSIINLSSKLNDNRNIHVIEKKEEDKSKKTIKKENLIQNKNKINTENYDNIKQIRINNVLAGANKQILKEVLNKIENLDDYISNKNYNNAVSILSEGKMVVASNEYLMFSYSDEVMLLLFYNNIKVIEELIKNVFNKDYKIVAVLDSEWEHIKQEYIKALKENKKYDIIEETGILSTEKKKMTKFEKKATDIFGENVVTVK